MSVILTDNKKKSYCEAMSEGLPVLRARLGVTQEELANRIGLSRNMLACIEIKKKEMSWKTFVALSLLFARNENTSPILKTMRIYDQKLDDYLMFK